jgi:hypothetical protein
MNPYEIEEHFEEGYLVLNFPPSSSWLGSARIIAQELSMFLNTVHRPITVLIDISKNKPTLTFVSVKNAISDYSVLREHKNLKQIILITEDYVIRRIASEFVNKIPNFQLYSSRKGALFAIQQGIEKER